MVSFVILMRCSQLQENQLLENQDRVEVLDKQRFLQEHQMAQLKNRMIPLQEQISNFELNNKQVNHPLNAKFKYRIFFQINQHD